MTTILIISSILSWTLLLLNLLFTVALVKRVNQMQGSGSSYKDLILKESVERRGEIAPPFAVKNRAGETVTLNSFDGCTVTFVFLSPACKPCVEKIPDLNAYYAEAAGPDREIVAVNTDPDAHTDGV